MVLNYDCIIDIKATIYHELINIENHLTFISDKELKIILKDCQKGNFLQKDYCKLIELDLIDEFIAINNHNIHTLEYYDYLEDFKDILKNINSNEKTIYSYRKNGYFKYFPYVLAYKKINDNYPEELKNELYDITCLLENRLNQMYLI